MITLLVADRISNEEFAAGESGSAADFGGVVVEIREGTSSNELVQNMTWIVEERQLDVFRTPKAAEFINSIPEKSKELKVFNASVRSSGVFTLAAPY